MAGKIMALGSSGLMLTGLIILTWGFRDLPIDERPEWMVAEMIIWPLVAMGLIEMARLYRYRRQGLRVHADRWQLASHGLPALLIAVTPAGSFTNWFGPTNVLAMLDFPTAKVMAALWLGFACWSAWEVSL